MRRRVRKILAEKLELRVPKSAQVLTTSEVARFLRVTRWTLGNWRKDGAGPPFIKLSRQIVRYPRGAFERWMYRHLQGASRGRCCGMSRTGKPFRGLAALQHSGRMT